MPILDKMTDANRKEMLAGLFLSKFNTRESKAGLMRLGYAKFKDAYEGLAALVGGNPLSVRNYRDEFDPAFENGRTGYNMRLMHPTRREMLDAYGWIGMETTVSSPLPSSATDLYLERTPHLWIKSAQGNIAA